MFPQQKLSCKNINKIEEKKIWVGEAVNLNTEFFKKIIREPETPASTWVKRVTESMIKQRHKLKY